MMRWEAGNDALESRLYLRPKNDKMARMITMAPTSQTMLFISSLLLKKRSRCPTWDNSGRSKLPLGAPLRTLPRRLRRGISVSIPDSDALSGSEHMRRSALILAAPLLAALLISSPAAAFESTAAGIGSGVLAGAVVAGPIGAVVGGLTGGYIGSRYERRRSYAPRRRAVRRGWREPRRTYVTR